jgi:alkaline phosphatase D
MRRVLVWLAALAWLTLGGVVSARAEREGLRITHGVASGDPTANGVVIWARASGTARMIVEYTSVGAPTWPPRRTQGPMVGPATDFTGKVVIDGLDADTPYLYWVRFRDPRSGLEVVSETGQFRTMPAGGADRGLTLVWWGDLGGQGYCRDPERGYALFTQMARVGADLAVANGDNVYVDSTCPPVTSLADHPRNAVSPDPQVAFHQLVDGADPRWTTPAQVLSAYRAKWKYNLEDVAYRRFRAQTPHAYQWDDHDVINDWSPGELRTGAIRGTADPRPMTALARPGRQVLFEYTPLRPEPGGRIYRTLGLGRLAQLWLLDARSYRDDNALPDRPGVVLDVRLAGGERRRLEGKSKSILGTTQREWLLRSLKEAQARGIVWKIISTNDALSVPSGSYPVLSGEGEPRPLYTVRDGWAAGPRLNGDTDGNQDNPSGFQSELRSILAFIKTEKITNVVWLATDVHHARLLRYEPAGDLAGLVFHEFVSGPVSALTLPPVGLSTAFGPVDLYARGRAANRPSFLNFGVVVIADDGTLTVEIRDLEGRIVPDDQGRPGTLTLTPQR